MENYEEQHPIPQNISSYQFHLVGDMTLKQFAQVGGGALVAIILYSTSFHALIKWPLAIFAFIFGAALAFFPFQDRPLDKWLVLFFKAVYNPTIFKWRKTDPKTLLFQPEETAVQGIELPQVSAPQDSNLDKNEKQILTRVADLFSSLVPKFGSGQVNTIPVGGSPSTTGPVVETVELNQNQIPQPEVINVESVPISQVPMKPVEINPAAPTSAVDPAYGTAGSITSQTAQFSPDAAPPIPPTRPNIVVGQVVGPKKEIVEGAILEIKDYNNRPIRALKSNKLGHFMIVTPLLDGKYEIVTEKDGFEFEPVSFDARSEIIPPMVVSAKSYVDVVTVEED